MAQPIVSDKGRPFLRVSLYTQITALNEIITYTARTMFERVLDWDSGKLSPP